MHRRKLDAYELTGSQKKTHEHEVTGAQKKKIAAYKLMDSQKTREYNLKGAQKTDGEYELMDSQKIVSTIRRVRRKLMSTRSVVR